MENTLTCHRYLPSSFNALACCHVTEFDDCASSLLTRQQANKLIEDGSLVGLYVT